MLPTFFFCYYEQAVDILVCFFVPFWKKRSITYISLIIIEIEILCNICLPFDFPLLWVVMFVSFPTGFQNWFVEILVYSSK